MMNGAQLIISLGAARIKYASSLHDKRLMHTSPSNAPTYSFSKNSFSWKWLMVVCLLPELAYTSLLRLARGFTFGSYSTRSNLPPNVRQRAMPMAPMASIRSASCAYG